MTAQQQKFEDETEAPTIRVVEGWIGNWRISLRRRDTSREDYMAYSRYMNETGD